MSGSYRAWAVDWTEGEHRSKGTEYSVGVGPSRKNGHKLEDDQVLGTIPAPSGQTHAPGTVGQSASPFLLGTPNEVPQTPAPSSASAHSPDLGGMAGLAVHLEHPPMVGKQQLQGLPE